MKTIVWLHGDSMGEGDPAARKYPEAERIFVFDQPFLERAKLSFKRIFFLYECAIEVAQEIRVGETGEELIEAAKARGAERLAVTESPSPRWREVVEGLEKKLQVEIIPAVQLVEVPQNYEAKRFTPFWKQLGKEWNR